MKTKLFKPQYLKLQILFIILISVSLKSFGQQVPDFHDVDASKLLLIYNENDGDDNNNGIPDSKELALYYKEKRNVPDSNLLGIYVSTTNYYYYSNQWANFWNEMVIPIQNKLANLGDTNIYYILLSDKIPYKLVLPSGSNTSRSLDNALSCLNNLGTLSTPNFPTYYSTNPFYESSPTDFTDQGNFNHNYQLSGTHIYLVSRLIGTDLRMKKNMIDMTLYGDKYMSFNSSSDYYKGTAYVDYRYGVYDDSTLIAGYHYSPSSYGEFDKDAAYIKFFYQMAGVPYKLEPNDIEIGEVNALFTDSTTADSGRNAILYGGWYNYGTYHDVWDWLPGAYACDLNSNSGANIRSGSGSFLSGAFANGLTCGTGCIGEPYLSGHSQPDIFLYYFLKGYNFIESAYHAEPKFKWQGIIVGDPLYNPFRYGKIPQKDTSIALSQISFNFIDSSEIHIHIDYNTSIEFPEVVKAKLLWGESSVFSDTIDYEDIYFAHHKFELTNLHANITYFFQISVVDPVNNFWASDIETFTTTGNSSLVQSVFFTDNSTICKNDTAYFTNFSSGNNSYLWQENGVTFDTLENTFRVFNNTGSYEISLIASNETVQDTAFETIVVSSPNPLILPQGELLYCNYHQSYQWYFDGNLIPGATNYIFQPELTGNYSVAVTDEFGCWAISNPTNVIITNNNELLFSTLNLYPNPFKDFLSIEYFISNIAEVSIEIYNIFGSKIKTYGFGKQDVGYHKFEIIDKSEIPEGVYIVQLFVNNQMYRKKILHMK
ncbi:MAG: TIGR03790 family protein [Bacteroidetes bacterium]|jgi:uncharacterized protein (TIGR03790 family)|nr:TIGR03790 family protein [Bacteroidota bacterium]MBT6685451.1 TIGR03790 family protein [Bacteroidota bacterium]MBT7144800.1 TIGR03790 family protein [Bacteroidota bacterium]MBT7490552.1 TIGR03790 family protein [Bacteroidota bacterium]